MTDASRQSNVDHVVVFRDDSGEWRWHGIAKNGEIVAEGESHTRAEDAARAATGVLGDSVRVVLHRGESVVKNSGESPE